MTRSHLNRISILALSAVLLSTTACSGSSGFGRTASVSGKSPSQSGSGGSSGNGSSASNGGSSGSGSGGSAGGGVTSGNALLSVTDANGSLNVAANGPVPNGATSGLTGPVNQLGNTVNGVAGTTTPVGLTVVDGKVLGSGSNPIQANVLSGGKVATASVNNAALGNILPTGGDVLPGTNGLAKATVGSNTVINGSSPLVGASVNSANQTNGSLATVGALSGGKTTTASANTNALDNVLNTGGALGTGNLLNAGGAASGNGGVTSGLLNTSGNGNATGNGNLNVGNLLN